MTAPEEIHGVSNSQFSVARHYGGCTFQGRRYVYDASADRLVRSDIHAARIKAGGADAKAWSDAERKRWTEAQKTLI